MGNPVSKDGKLSKLQLRILRHLMTVERAAGSDFTKTFTKENMKKLNGTRYPMWVRSFLTLLRVGPGRLYPDLMILEKNRLINSEWEERKVADARATAKSFRDKNGQVPRKRYYFITPQGMQLLAKGN